MTTAISDLTIFKNFTENEQIILGKTLAKIFTKRFVKSDMFKKYFQSYGDIVKIERGLPENFTIPGPSYMPFGWIADEKFKVFTGVTVLNPEKSRYIAVWLDIRVNRDSFFEKARMDIMHFVSKREYDLVFSCNVYPDFDKNALILQIYHLQSDIGWRKITEFSYSGMYDSNQLSPFERGQIGESLGRIFTERLLYDDRSSFFPETNTDPIFIEECIFPRKVLNFTQNPQTLESWVPDIIFQVYSNHDASELKYEFYPKKTIYVEVKTGKNAKFERWQKEDICRYSKIAHSIVLFCEILPDSERDIVQINIKKLSDNIWKTCKSFNYSNFGKVSN